MQTATRSLVARPGVGFTANVVQHSALRISQVTVESPALIFLRHGTKTLRAGDRQWTVQGGDAVLVAGGLSVDVFNQLSADGLYEARWLVWDNVSLVDVQRAGAGRKPLTEAALIKGVSDAFAQSMARAVEAISRPEDIPESIARHRLAELLLWLDEHGLSVAAPQTTTTVARLRKLLVRSLADEWTASQAADHLAMSGATLRRRLSAEGTSFAAVLTDARMSSAMTLLQSTDRAVGHIASDVGYESASRFSVRFRSRFGIAPSAVRGHRR